MLDRSLLGNRSLPFWKMASEIWEMVEAGRGVLVMPTGIGKTTQIGPLLHETGYTDSGMIVISVPKRVLAVELATRVASEMDCDIGDLVGYQIRAEKRMSHKTKILFVTGGILRGMIQRDPMLEKVSVVVFDEFHERLLDSDLNVGLVERAQKLGSKVKFLLMSATAVAEPLAKHFGCGMVNGEGLSTLFPVVETFVNLNLENNGDLYDELARQVERLITTRGDHVNGLIFMPGKEEIARAIEAIKRLNLQLPVQSRILPLHGDLPPEERHAPFADFKGLTITVATDIAETGVTLPKIGWVIDSGLAREIYYSAASDTSGLGVTKIAQDRLKQRLGRAGREASGECVRLFSEIDKSKRAVYTTPEILRMPLREVSLVIKSLGLKPGETLRFIDNPPDENWAEAERQLLLLGLIDRRGTITELGKKCVRMGCDPRDAVILMNAAKMGCPHAAAIVIGARNARLFYLPSRKHRFPEWLEANTKHQRFKASATFDCWAEVEVLLEVEKRGEMSLGEWCMANAISYRGLQETWRNMWQLIGNLQELYGELDGSNDYSQQALQAAIATGFPDKVFQRGGRGKYWTRLADETYFEAILARESVTSIHAPGRVIAWDIVEIAPPGGFPFNLITSALAFH